MAVSGQQKFDAQMRRKQGKCRRPSQSRPEVPACSGSRRGDGPSQPGAFRPNLLEPVSRNRRGQSGTRTAEGGARTDRERAHGVIDKRCPGDCDRAVEIGSRGRAADEWSTSPPCYSRKPACRASFTSRSFRRGAAKRACVRRVGADARRTAAGDVAPMPRPRAGTPRARPRRGRMREAQDRDVG